MFTKDDFLLMSCSIHPCPCLYLWLAVACSYLAPKLLNNVVVSLLTLSSVLPCVFLVIHVPYELALAMLCFINVSSYCWLPCDAMKCFVVSGMSLQSCYHEYVSAMLCFSSKCETVHFTCHVCIDAIIFSVHLWLKLSKGVLFIAFSTSMPCLPLPWYVHVACCLLALNIATWCWLCHV